MTASTSLRYLGGNTNLSIEQVAGVVGKNGFHVAAGLEGGYVAEQLTGRAGAVVHKVEMLQLADEVDAQEIYYRAKYEKSEIEMRLIADASVIADAMMSAMLAVRRPGRLETEIAAWGAWVGRMLGAEADGFRMMVGANEANRTLIGPALNRPIRERDWVHLGVAPQRDGLTSCVRRSAIAVDSPSGVTQDQRFWMDLVEDGYRVSEEAYREVAAESLPARLQEQALVDYFAGRAGEVSARIYCVVENTLSKDGGSVECLTRVPIHAQELVGY